MSPQDERRKRAASGGDNTAGGLLRDAVKAVPQVRWAVGVLGVAAATSLLFGLFANKVVAIAGTVVMLLLMALLVVFARGVAALSRTKLELPALFFMWAAMILTVVPVTLAMSSFFVNWPMTRQDLLNTHIPGIHPKVPETQIREWPFKNERVSFDHLPPAMLEALENGATVDDLSQSLAEKGSIRLDNACLVLGGMASDGAPARTLTLNVHTLSFNGSSCIVTNGNSLILTVVDLLGSGGTIRSFEDPTPPPAPAGSRGVDGHDGGTVSIRVLRRVEGPLSVDLRGQNGGKGGKGLPGHPGPAGTRGADGVTGAFGCLHGGQDGSAGGPGSQGQPGSPGGNGGSGGTLILRGVAVSAATEFYPTLTGGSKGLGGDGGDGGPGGPGGEGGSGNGFCGGGHGGPPGPAGGPGPQGPQGERTGADGSRVMRPGNA